jgi:hypothetical protein
VRTATDTECSIANWLARSLDAPEVARQEWRRGRLAMLRTGGVFDAIRVPQELVHAAVGSTDPEVVSGALAELCGPVICDRATWYYALVLPGTSETWRSPLAQVRGMGGWLGVPPIGITEPEGVYWSVPPLRAGGLCATEAVTALLAIGRDQLEAAS